jgi:hypothetical protein
MKSVRVVGEVVGEVVVKALDIGEDREGVNEAQLGNVVRRDMLKLHNGTRQGNSMKMQLIRYNVDNGNKDNKQMIMNISSRYHCSKENLDTDLLLMSDSFSLYSNHSHFPVAQLGCSFSANIVFLVLHALQLGTLIKAHQASATSNFTVLNWVLLHKLSSFFFY